MFFSIPFHAKKAPVKRRWLGGFSLAEVLMAVGVTAIGVTSLVGLVPSGLESLRKSAAKVAEAKIIQAVTADYQMGDWGSRQAGQTLADREYYFDEQGLQVGKNDTWRHYTAKANIERGANEAGGYTLLGDPSANKYIFRLTIRITDQENADAAFADLDGKKFNTYANMVALIEQTNSANPLIY